MTKTIKELKETIESYKKIADDDIKKGTSLNLQIFRSKGISELCTELLKMIDESSEDCSAEEPEQSPVMGLGDYLEITSAADAASANSHTDCGESPAPQPGKRSPYHRTGSFLTEDELFKIRDRKERFELSMLYLLLHGGGSFIPELSVEDLQNIFRSVKYVKEACDYQTMKEGSEYLNIKIADDAYNDHFSNGKVFEETPDAPESQEENPETSVRKVSNEELKKEVEKFMDDPVFGKLMNFFAAYGLAKHIASLFTNGRH